MQGVIVAPRVHQRSQRDVHGVRPRDHVLRKFPCVCGSLSLGAVWVLAPGLERRGVCVPFLDAGGRARPVPYVPWNAVVLRSGATHRARNFGQAVRVDTSVFLSQRFSHAQKFLAARTRTHTNTVTPSHTNTHVHFDLYSDTVSTKHTHTPTHTYTHTNNM